MKKCLFLLFFSGIYILLYSQESALSYPCIWLQSETIETQQAYWQDAVKLSRKARPDSNGYFPGSTWFNFNKALSLDSLSNSLKIPYTFDKQSNLSIIVVYHTPDTLNEQGIWQLEQAGEARAFLTTRHLGTTKSIQYTEEPVHIPAIHTYIPSFRNPLEGDYTFTIGSTDSVEFHGRIAEFMTYDKSLQGEELQKIQTCLAIKYGISLEQMNYTSSSGTILWDTLSCEAYWHDIAGIGRDDYFGLHQKQSSSSSGKDYITIGLGNIYPRNDANPGEIPEGDFLVWGHNNGDLQAGTDYSPSGGLLAERRWKLRRSGTTASYMPSILVLDLSDLNRDSIHTCHLLIDRSGEGDFSFMPEYIEADSISPGGRAYFRNIRWDTDQSGSDVFTFSFNDPVVLDPEDNPEENKKSTLGSKNKDHESGSGNSSGQPGLSGEPHYSLSPNPTSGNYTLELSYPDITSVRIRLSDAGGKTVSEKKLQGSASYTIQEHISISGIYLIEVESSYEAQTFKLVVNR